MTALLLAALALLFGLAIYLGVMSARWAGDPAEFVDAGSRLPPWTLIFAATGILLGSLGLNEHFRLTALYGLPYSQVALGLTLAALCGALLHKRLWLAARHTGLSSPIALFGAYYGSTALRVILLGLALIFAVPFAALNLALAGELIATATAGALAPQQAVLALAVFLFLFSSLGGWRGVIYVIAAQSFVLIALVLFTGLFMANAFDALAVLSAGSGTTNAVASAQISEVLQSFAGIGKDATSGGIFTSMGILSFSLSLIGIVLSPAMSFLAITVKSRSGFAFHQVWMVAGLATGALLIIAPIIGAELAASDPAGLNAGAPGYLGLIQRFAALDAFAAVCFLLMLLGAAQIVVAFFAAAGANLLTIDLVERDVLPGLSSAGRRLAARITLAVLYAIIVLAAWAPLTVAIVGSVALSLAAQLLPAFIGLCWAPFISRRAVLTGLLFGALLVIFTEPPGLIALEGLFFDLPWGRWPLTIHSAAWGLLFNFAACLIVAVFTGSDAERWHREILHRAFRDSWREDAGGRAMRNARWSLTLIWTFMALGPGAILGNSFFSNPMFAEQAAKLAMPSLWVWQIVFWLIGVLLVWWLAYAGRMSVIAGDAWRRVDLSPPADPLERRRPPRWISLLLARVAAR